MALWLVTRFPTAELVGLVVGGMTLLAVSVALIIRKAFPAVTEGAHNETVGLLLELVGIIYGILLAFVIVILWEAYQEAGTLVDSEANSLTQVVRTSEAFSPEAHARIDAAVHDYVHAMVRDEWPLMRNGVGRRAAPSGTEAVANLYAAMHSYEPDTDGRSALYSQAISKLDDVASFRRARLERSRRSLPSILQGLIMGGSVMVIGVSVLFGIRNRSLQLLFVTLIAIVISLSLLVTVVFSYPFSGDLGIQSNPLQEGLLARYFTAPG
jgi:hypothetical protein